jgi:hypothetical protein
VAFQVPELGEGKHIEHMNVSFDMYAFGRYVEYIDVSFRIVISSEPLSFIVNYVTQFAVDH